MPQMKYLSISESANLLILEQARIENINKIFLKILEGKGVSSDVLSLVYADKSARRLNDDVKYAKENPDSIRGKHFLRDLYRLLKYMEGDKKYEDVLNEIEDKKVAKTVKKAHMVNADPKESGPWIITNECDDQKTFFDIYHKLLEKVKPEVLVQYWSTPNKDNKPYMPIIEKINKFKQAEEAQWNDRRYGTKVSTKDDSKGIRYSLEHEVQSLTYPDNYKEIMSEMARGANKPKEPTIEDLQNKIKELEAKLEEETRARKLAELNLGNLRTRVLSIGPLGRGAANAKELAQKMERY